MNSRESTRKKMLSLFFSFFFLCCTKQTILNFVYLWTTISREIDKLGGGKNGGSENEPKRTMESKSNSSLHSLEMYFLMLFGIWYKTNQSWFVADFFSHFLSSIFFNNINPAQPLNINIPLLSIRLNNLHCYRCIWSTRQQKYQIDTKWNTGCFNERSNSHLSMSWL